MGVEKLGKGLTGTAVKGKETPKGGESNHTRSVLITAAGIRLHKSSYTQKLTLLLLRCSPIHTFSTPTSMPNSLEEAKTFSSR